MRKLFFLLVLLLTMGVYGGCSKKTDESLGLVDIGTVSSESETQLEDEGYDEEEFEEVKVMLLQDQNIEFAKLNYGDERSYGGDYAQGFGLGVAEKDGYTYILYGLPSITGSNPSSDNKLQLTIMKDDELVIEKEIDLMELLDFQNTGINFGKIINYGNEVFFEVKHTFTEKYMTMGFPDDDIFFGYYHMTFNEHGDLETETIYEEVLKSYYTLGAYIKGVDGNRYILQRRGDDVLDKFVITNLHNEEIDSGDLQENMIGQAINSSSFSGWIYDKDRKLLFTGSTPSEVYDTEANDLVWNDDGSKNSFMPFGDEVSYSPFRYFNVDNTDLYTLDRERTDQELILKHFTIDDYDSTLSDELIIQSDLKFTKVDMSYDEENIYIYTEVDFKGKPTVQKYTVNRID